MIVICFIVGLLAAIGILALAVPLSLLAGSPICKYATGYWPWQYQNLQSEDLWMAGMTGMISVVAIVGLIFALTTLGCEILK